VGPPAESSRREAGGKDAEERERIWTAQKSDYPGFADYEQRTDRQIPVVILRTRP
jgi:F420H(2)-dependent quinone reductase